MKRLITFLDEAAGIELTLPVTPSGYEWARRAVIETVDVDQLGAIHLFGGRDMTSATLRGCILPAHAYSFLSPGASTDPWTYVDQLGRWVEAGTVLRYLVSDTPVNEAVLLEAVTCREQDGTNDLYADITIRQYVQPETPVIPAQAQSTPTASRDSATGTSQSRTYQVVSGDTMWDICRRYYGDGSLCWALASYNQVKNANLIYPGQVFSIPPKSALTGGADKPESARIAEASTAAYTGSGWTISLPEGG